MWLTRDKDKASFGHTIDIHVQDEKPSIALGCYREGDYGFNEDSFELLFPNTPLPRKGSCREIKGLQIVEVE